MPEPMSLTEFRQHLAELLDLRLGEIPDDLDSLWGLIKPALTVTRADRDRWMGVATSEQTAHAATQAALTSTREENQRLRVDTDHRQQIINEAHTALNTAGAPHGYPAQRIAHLLAERDHWKRAATGAEEVSAATEAENQRLRADLATLQARAAKAIAATITVTPDGPWRIEGDVRDGVQTPEDAAWEALEELAGCGRMAIPHPLAAGIRWTMESLVERAELAEYKLSNARRLSGLLVGDIIDGRRR